MNILEKIEKATQRVVEDLKLPKACYLSEKGREELKALAPDRIVNCDIHHPPPLDRKNATIWFEVDKNLKDDEIRIETW